MVKKNETNEEQASAENQDLQNEQKQETPVELPKAKKWQSAEQYFHFFFDGDLTIDRDVLKIVTIEEVAAILAEVFARVNEEALKTDTLYFNNDTGYRLVVKDSHSREALQGSDVSRSGNWHRNNNHRTSVTIERVSWQGRTKSCTYSVQDFLSCKAIRIWYSMVVALISNIPWNQSCF